MHSHNPELRDALQMWGSDLPGVPGRREDGQEVNLRLIGKTLVVNESGTTKNTPITEVFAQELYLRFLNS